MENILLLGNGFDLHFKLPTKYSNFLNVAAFLSNNQKHTFETIGEVLSNESLQTKDPFLCTCYEAHQKIYDSTTMDQNAVSEIVNITANNIWFEYLHNAFNKNVGWIDFEKEIGTVLDFFKKEIKKKPIFEFSNDDNYEKFFLNHFNFFANLTPPDTYFGADAYEVNKDYLLEQPLGSKNYLIDGEKVVTKLYEDLRNLSKALKIYLQCFVENTLEALKKDTPDRKISLLYCAHKVVTFNYTHTYEKLYGQKTSFHIHGNTDDEIVLGINPDETDTLESIDTTFVYFKKYYQRTLFETDIDYLRWISDTINTRMPYRLFVMGHSLNITDKDIISELFLNAQEIFILYHDFDAKKSYTANLVNLFGKEIFDILKKDKKLTFLSQNHDLSSIKAMLNKEIEQQFQTILVENIPI